MPSVGFEPKISAGERPKTYVLDRAATAGTGKPTTYKNHKKVRNFKRYGKQITEGVGQINHIRDPPPKIVINYTKRYIITGLGLCGLL
jgi:hypothetical protein